MNTIRAIRVPLVVLLILIGLGAASVAWAAEALPDRVASHFDAQGRPNGWSSRANFLQSMSAIGLLLPLFVLGTGLVTALLPSGTINLPHREYWLSPEHRGETNRYIAGHMAWLTCLMMGLFLALNWLFVQTQREAPPRLSNAIWLLVIAFLGSVVAWLVAFVRHFSRPPREPVES